MSKQILTLESFKKIAQYCRHHIKGLGPSKNPAYAQIFEILSTSIEKYSHFEILGNDKDKILFVEFHIEGEEKTEMLQTVIKYWNGIYVFDKKIQYDPKWRKKGRLRIGCSYSYGAEKICAYINEFIYQIKSRIESIISEVK
jgi:hypothetical protein